ncbi:MAG TPA: rhomboid family intramembrane serine protease [Candidatus Angelobacter sp.]|nr:rhomboid family intramembrane serine protease [Candidatus Angelobacter sp.]
MILIPLKHENMEGRRWPVVTFALIALNILAFLGTHWTIEKQEPELLEVRFQVLLYAASHSEATLPDDLQQLVTDYQQTNPEGWKQISTQYKEFLGSDVSRLQVLGAPGFSEPTLDELASHFREVREHSLLENYAFVPAHKRPIAYLTSIFLHAGWFHLIGNMWFLWLSGFILEENWGRAIYSVFYLLAGVAATVIYGAMNPGSVVPCLGASGAIAGLMGAFLMRFPKLKIDMWGTAFFVRFRFKAPAYTLLPLWLLMEIFYGAMVGKISGVAHWAHVGGFVFGIVAALVIQRTGWEHQANAAIEEKVGWTADPAIVQGTELMNQGKVDEAIAVLQKYVATKPDAVDAYFLLQQLYWRKNDLPKHHDVSIKLCQLHLKAHDTEAAWQDYQEYLNTGGKGMPAPTWRELCRLAEGQQNFERAASEYAHLAEAYPTERPALLALLSAGRLCLKKLNRPTDALRYYKAAAASPVPHLDWQTNIDAGIRDAEKAISGACEPVAKL